LTSKLEYIASGNTLPYEEFARRTNPALLQGSEEQLEGEDEEEQETDNSVMRDQNELLDREIRLFISSPFVDMKLERDYLVKLVVPQIRRMCVERDIIFNFVDLRWGITDAQTSQSTMILMCLRELQRSNLFVGCLGERYGYSIPPSVKAIRSGEEKERVEAFQRAFKLAAKEFPWISQYSDRSITELEMRDIMRDETRSDSSWFFIRDPYYLEEIPENERAAYRCENEESGQKLERLKDDIENCACPFISYKRPDHFADLLVEELRKHVDDKYPQDYVISDFARDRFRHQVYAKSLTSVYLPDETEFVTIDKFVMGDAETPFVVCGSTGIGKSALLANWAQRHQNHHPEDIIISHYVTCAPAASDHVKMIHRIMLEILDSIQHYDRSVLIALSDVQHLSPENQRQKILDEFPVWIERLFEQKITNRFILIIDGIDNIEDRDNALDFTWLPRTFPPGIRVLTSATDNAVHKNLTLKLLRKRKCPELLLEALNIGQKKSFIVQYLQNTHGKKLSEYQELRIAESFQSGNPRFLQTLLDEICVSATHENLDSSIDLALQARNTSQLYEIVLSRMDKDYDTKRKGFIKAMFCFIAVSRNGLHASDELGLLMLRPKADGKAFVSEEEFSTLYLMIGSLFSTAGGLLTFSNEDIKSAVESLYLKDVSVAKEYHLQLAELFTERMQDNITNDRVVSELPWHLEKSEQFDKLRDFLCDIRVIDQMCSDVYSFQLEQYWRALEAMGHNVEKEYVTVLQQTRQFPPSIVRADLLFKIANFFISMSKYEGAEKMLLLARTHYENSSSTLNLALVDCSLGNLYSLLRKHEKAIVCLKRSLQCYEKEGGEPIEQCMTMERLGTVYMNSRKLAEAKEILNSALEICERKYGAFNNTTADIIYDIGCIIFAEARGGCGGIDQDKAEEWLRRALEIKASLLGDWHPEVARVLNRLGSIFVEQNQFNDAEACYEQALLIRQEKLGKHATRTLQTLKHMISCYEMQEKNSEALSVCKQAKEITDIQFGSKSEESVSIQIRIGILYWLIEQRDEALSILKDAKEIRISTFGADHAKVKEVEDTIADLLSSIAPPPPPPPPPMVPKPVVQYNIIPKQEIAVPKKPSIAVGPDGIPLPPPPPPPLMSKPCAVQQRSSAPIARQEMSPMALLEDIRQVGLRKQEVKHDRSDAKAQYGRMMGQQKRKMMLKKLK